MFHISTLSGSARQSLRRHSHIKIYVRSPGAPFVAPSRGQRQMQGAGRGAAGCHMALAATAQSPPTPLPLCCTHPTPPSPPRARTMQLPPLCAALNTTRRMRLPRRDVFRHPDSYSPPLSAMYVQSRRRETNAHGRALRAAAWGSFVGLLVGVILLSLLEPRNERLGRLAHRFAQLLLRALVEPFDDHVLLEHVHVIQHLEEVGRLLE